MTSPYLVTYTDPLPQIPKLVEPQSGTQPTMPPKPFTPATATSSTSTPTTSPSPAAAALPDFREILAVMMMGMAMQGQGGEEGGFSFSSMMAPLMMTLMEQLMSQEATGDLTREVTTPQLVPQGLPVEGRFTQDFHPGHTGIDIAIVVGTPIQSTMDGNVVYAGWNNQGYGNLVIVENGPYRTYYAHLSEIPVEVGQSVTAGDVIGLSGNTGNSTGPHLHYEVRYNGQPLDPAEFY